MKPTLRQIEALVLAYRLGSLTKAAADMNLTQSAVSLLIRQLEESFELRLFDRTTRALRPTAACIEAVPIAERILADAGGLSHRMRDLLAAKSGRVVFAASAGFASALLPRVLAGYRAAYPEVTVEMFDVAADSVLPAVIGGKAEFGLGTIEGEHTAEVILEPLMRSPLCAIGIRDGKFETHRTLAWDSIQDQPLIAMRQGTHIRVQIDQAMAKAGRALKPALEVSLIATALNLTAEGLGLSILPAHMLPAAQFPTLAAVPLSRPTITRHVSLVSRVGISLSPAAQRFIDMAKQSLAGKSAVALRTD